MIDIADLSFTYPEQGEPALRDISLQIEAGAFVLLSGVSGSGKSTLMRCLNGLIPHLSGGTISGHIRVNGLNPVLAGPQQMSRQVAFVFQNPEAQAILDRVEPEIAFGLENNPHTVSAGPRPSPAEAARLRQEMQARVTRTLDLLYIGHLRQRLLRTLSGGERQKVALASALVLEPALLVLDEPTSQLDPEAAADLLDTLVRLNREHGYTILLAEHRLERVLPFVDRVVALAEGCLTLDAAPRDARPHLPHIPAVAEVDAAIRARQTVPAMPAPHLLTLTSLSFAYGRTRILRDLNLQVGPGELVALMGRNGTGKSTLLRCIVGLLKTDSDAVAVKGRSIRGRAVADICQDVAYLPQNPDDLLFADTVAAELAITLRNHGREPDPLAGGALLAQLGLAQHETTYPRDLSVGQRQRVALGAVTITEPDLILLDEPTRGLDYEAKAALVAIWQQLLAQGKAILLVTHDRTLVARAAQRVVILENGRLVEPAATAIGNT